MTAGPRPRRPTPQAAESLPAAPQTTPTGVGFGQVDYSFTLQAVMDMHKSVGELTSTVNALKTSIDSVKSKVDQLTDWKNRILGGAIALGAVCTLLGIGITKFSDYVTFKAPEKITLPSLSLENQQPPNSKIVNPPKK